MSKSKIESTRIEDDFVFDDGLYYPFIDIHDPGFLKTAYLYWNSISTIVPDEYQHSRTNETSQALAEENFLMPVVVAPEMDEVRVAADECRQFLHSPQGIEFLQNAAKRPRTLSDDADWHPEAINDRKLHDSLIAELRKRNLIVSQHGDWYRMPGWFARYYMTILATNIARSRGLSLLTDDVVAEPLANRAVRGDLPRQTPGSLAEGLLATMVLRTLHVSPSTPLKKLRAFKEDHQRELGEFKNALRELVKPIKGKTDLELLQKHLATVHKNQVAPKIGALQERLSDNRIACGYNNLKVSTLVSASPTALGVGMAAVGLGPFALVAGIGVSILLSLSNYELQKRELLRESPFSYVVLAEKKFSPRRK